MPTRTEPNLSSNKGCNEVTSIDYHTFLILCKSQAERVEDRQYNCLMSSLSAEERDIIKPIIKEFEQHLIEKEILENSTAKGYWNFYKKIADTGTLNVSNDYDFMSKISFLNRENPEENNGLINCQNEILQSDEYLNSNQNKLKEELYSLRKQRVTQKMIAHSMIKFLNVEDFESDYNKFMTLMYIEEMNSKSK